MFNIEETLAEFGLTPEKYEELLKDCSDKVHKLNESDWSEIASKYNIDWNGDSLRKAQQPPLLGGAFVREYLLWKNDEKKDYDGDYAKEIEVMRRELERMKVQYRDERNAWQKQNYIDARAEQKLSYLEEELKTLGRINFEKHVKPVVNGNKELIVVLSDLHIGQTFNSVFGEYNTDIAKTRLAKYLEEVKEVAELYGARKVNICSLGDQISGNIHKSISVTNRENVIEQIKIATELISSFCYECTKIFEIVQFYSVSGNHTRIDRKDDALKDERLDDTIAWAVGLSLNHIDNFHVMQHRNLDTGIADMNVCGKTYICVHGDHDAMTNQGVANLSMLLGFIPEGIFRGHMHYPAMNELNGVKVIQSGSLAGSGDDHTIESRLTGKPSQTICVCDNRGITAYIPVELN